MHWRLSNRADPEGRRMYSRHYSCPDPDSLTRQFVKPGSCLVLKTEAALWVTAAPIGAYVKHAWAGAWECAVFRNEGSDCSSELIREAVGLTLGHYGTPPELGMVTFIDPRHVPGYFVRTYEWAAYYPVTREYPQRRRIVVIPADAALLKRLDPSLGISVRREHFTELRWGYSFERAGFRHVGWTKAGLYAMQLLPADMPEPLTMPRAQQNLFEAA